MVYSSSWREPTPERESESDRKDHGDPIVRGILLLAGLDPDRASTQNEMGFNSYDGDFGHKLADAPSWTPKMRYAAWRMIAKYRRQLTDAGIDYDKIPEPPTGIESVVPVIASSAAPAPKPTNLIEVTDGKIICGFRYDPALVIAVKVWAAGGFNKPAGNKWIKPLTADTARGALKFAAEYKFTFADGAKVALEEAVSKAEASIAGSCAVSADFEVKGLKGTLRPFQRAGVKYLLEHQRSLLCDSPGLGKSIEAMAVLQHLNAFPALIVCPASLKFVWQRFVQSWLPGRLVSVANGKQPAKGAEVLIINYDLIWREQYKWLQDYPWVGLVLDEAHAIKSRDAKRSASVYDNKRVVDAMGKERWIKSGLSTVKTLRTVLLLTGTPVLNRPSELVMLLSAAGLIQHFGGSWKFLQRYCNLQHNGFGWDFSGASNLKELHDKLCEVGYVRRTKEEVLPELPPMQISDIPIQIDNREEYSAAEHDVLTWIAENIGDNAEMAAERAEALVRINTLKQLAAKGKLATAIEWIGDFLESGSKLVVFAEHIAIQKAVFAAFPTAAHVFGEDNVEERTAQVDRFQADPECRLMVASLVAGSEGLTMTAASHCAMLELGWNPARMEQAASRIHRIGQTASSVNIYNIIGENTIDEEIASLLAQKAAIVNAVTDGEVAGESSIFGDLVKKMATRKQS